MPPIYIKILLFTIFIQILTSIIFYDENIMSILQIEKITLYLSISIIAFISFILLF